MQDLWKSHKYSHYARRHSALSAHSDTKHSQRYGHEQEQEEKMQIGLIWRSCSFSLHTFTLCADACSCTIHKRKLTFNKVIFVGGPWWPLKHFLCEAIPLSFGGPLWASCPWFDDLEDLHPTPAVKQPLAFHSFHRAFTIWRGRGAWVMGFVWDRRKIKMLYSRAVSEMSRRTVCIREFRGGWPGDEGDLCTSVCICSVCVVFIKSSLRPIRSMNKSSEQNTMKLWAAVELLKLLRREHKPWTLLSTQCTLCLPLDWWNWCCLMTWNTHRSICQKSTLPLYTSLNLHTTEVITSQRPYLSHHVSPQTQATHLTPRDALFLTQTHAKWNKPPFHPRSSPP